VPLRDPEPVSDPDRLMVWDPVRLPVTVADMDRLFVMLGVSPLEALIDAVIVAVFVGDMEAVRLLVLERLPVREPVTVAVPVWVPV